MRNNYRASAVVEIDMYGPLKVKVLRSRLEKAIRQMMTSGQRSAVRVKHVKVKAPPRPKKPSGQSIGVRRAIKAAGNGFRLARAVGITPAAIYRWTDIPVERVKIVAKVTGLPRERLRPDIFT